jgi:hypothetical protein
MVDYRDYKSSLPVSDTWRVAQALDEDLNDTDKTVAVPAGKEWQILWVHVNFIANGTVGNRQVAIQILDSDDNVAGNFPAGLVQTAGLTYDYTFAPGMPDLATPRNTSYVLTPIPNIVLLAGQQIRVVDIAAVDADGDDMSVHIQYASRKV